MVPNEFATLLEMTLYKLVGNNLIPKAFVTNDFWRKLRTKFTNSGQYAKTTSRPRKTSMKQFKATKNHSQVKELLAPIEGGGGEGGDGGAGESGGVEGGEGGGGSKDEQASNKPTPQSTPVRQIPSLSQKKKLKRKSSSQASMYKIPRDRPSSEDFVPSPRAKRVEAINKSFQYYLNRNGLTREMLSNKE